MMTVDESNPSQLRGSWLKSRKLRRVGYLVMGVVVGIIALRLLWGLIAEHRLSALIASYRAAGGPVTVDDFNAELDRVPDAENAALLYEEAIDKYVGTSQSGEYLATFVDEPETFMTKPMIADELIEANASVLVMLHEARDKRSVAWSERLGVVQVNIFQSIAQRMIARVLWFACAYHVQNENHYEAVETLRDFVRFGDAVDSHPTRISNLVASAIQGLSFTIVERYGSDLEIGENKKSKIFKLATRKQLEHLIRELLADRFPKDAVIRSYLGSRAETLNYLETANVLDYLDTRSMGFMAKTPSKQIINFMLSPSLALDSIREAEIDTKTVSAVSSATWSEASDFLLDLQALPTLLTLLSRPLTVNSTWGSLNNQSLTVSIFFKTLSRRRMTAMALAIRLYTVDHGFRPADLTELVPRYLPSLPPDPFADGVASFGYRPNADRPFLYSIGLDGKDNEGKKVFRPDGRRDTERSDIVFYLEPEPKAPSPGEAHDDDENVEHEQG